MVHIRSACIEGVKDLIEDRLSGHMRYWTYKDTVAKKKLLVQAQYTIKWMKGSDQELAEGIQKIK